MLTISPDEGEDERVKQPCSRSCWAFGPMGVDCDTILQYSSHGDLPRGTQGYLDMRSKPCVACFELNLPQGQGPRGCFTLGAKW